MTDNSNDRLEAELGRMKEWMCSPDRRTNYSEWRKRYEAYCVSLGDFYEEVANAYDHLAEWQADAALTAWEDSQR